MEGLLKMEELKKVVAAILGEFVKVEQGNRITSNNMTGLQMQLFMALDGKVTIQAPEETE